MYLYNPIHTVCLQFTPMRGRLLPMAHFSMKSYVLIEFASFFYKICKIVTFSHVIWLVPDTALTHDINPQSASSSLVALSASDTC